LRNATTDRIDFDGRTVAERHFGVLLDLAVKSVGLLGGIDSQRVVMIKRRPTADFRVVSLLIHEVPSDVSAA
jgi:hypothetical protein